MFINFKAIGSPGRVPFNKQPRHVTVWYCLMCISPYLISRLVTLFFYVLCQIVYILFCLLRNECSVYYLQTNNKHLENSYLGFSVFLSRDKRLCRNMFTLIFLKLESSAYVELVITCWYMVFTKFHDMLLIRNLHWGYLLINFNFHTSIKLTFGRN